MLQSPERKQRVLIMSSWANGTISSDLLFPLSRRFAGTRLSTGGSSCDTQHPAGPSLILPCPEHNNPSLVLLNLGTPTPGYCSIHTGTWLSLLLCFGPRGFPDFLLTSSHIIRGAYFTEQEKLGGFDGDTRVLIFSGKCESKQLNDETFKVYDWCFKMTWETLRGRGTVLPYGTPLWRGSGCPRERYIGEEKAGGGGNTLWFYQGCLS